MTNDEFSSQFDIYYNNVTSNAAPGLNEYEKSVFLTRASEDIVIELYNGRSVPGVSFESTEELRRYLSSLVKEYKVGLEGASEYEVTLPEDLWFITQETGIIKEDSCLNGKELAVVPIRQDELYRIRRNPFRNEDNRILRTDIDGKVILYSKHPISKYLITYIKHPNPIITESLEGLDVTIENKTESTTDIHPILHRAILERAVALAKIAYIGK